MNAKTLRRAVIAILAVYLVAMVGLGARAQSPDRWSRFNATRTTSQVVRIVVRTRCLNAEDSAAHLRLVNYGGGRAVYGCSRKGY
jgi:hypothetical protein